MKKTFLLFAACLLSTATWAQTAQIGNPNAEDIKAVLTTQESGPMQNDNKDTEPVSLLCIPTVFGRFGNAFGLENTFMWYVCDRTTLAIRGEGDMPDFDHYVDPNGNPELFTPWYSQIERTITRLVIQEGIKRIGRYTVPFSLSLEEISLPNSLESLQGSFTNCLALKEVILPEGLRMIGNATFLNCPALSQITIPSTVTHIGDFALGKCSALRSITIKNSVPPMLGRDVFAELDPTLCTLMVPVGSKAAYEAEEVWNLFNIVEGSVSLNYVENAEKTLVSYYNIMGQKLSKEPESGLYILLYDDGTTEKRLKK